MVYMVEEMGPEGEKLIGEVKNEGNPWVVAGMTEACWQNWSKVGGNCWDSAGLNGNPKKVDLLEARGKMPMTLEAWMPKKFELT